MLTSDGVLRRVVPRERGRIDGYNVLEVVEDLEGCGVDCVWDW